MESGVRWVQQKQTDTQSKRETLQYKVSENSTTFCLKERVLTEDGRPKEQWIFLNDELVKKRMRKFQFMIMASYMVTVCSKEYVYITEISFE